MTAAPRFIVGADSTWAFVECGHRYQRRPITPRERPEWGDEHAGPCEDYRWHRYVRWWVTEDELRLIVLPFGFRPFWAPLVTGLPDRFDLVSELDRRLAADVTESVFEGLRDWR